MSHLKFVLTWRIRFSFPGENRKLIFALLRLFFVAIQSKHPPFIERHLFWETTPYTAPFIFANVAWMAPRNYEPDPFFVRFELSLTILQAASIISKRRPLLSLRASYNHTDTHLQLYFLKYVSDDVTIIISSLSFSQW